MPEQNKDTYAVFVSLRVRFDDNAIFPQAIRSSLNDRLEACSPLGRRPTVSFYANHTLDSMFNAMSRSTIASRPRDTEDLEPYTRSRMRQPREEGILYQ